MALANPFDPPPNTPLVKDPTVWAQWAKWFWQIYKRIQTGATGGTVTSVGLSLPTSVFDVTGSPVTGSGTLTAAFDDQTNNTVFAGPATAPADTPAFRALVAADLPAGTGTVTSVALTMPTGVFDVAGSPITTSGTLAVTFDTQAANTAFMGPTTGAAATPAFRTLVAADIPTNAPLTIGTTPIVSGTAGRVLFEASGNVLQEDAGLSYDAATDTLTTVNLSATGNTTLGNASGDSLTINAGTWTYGNNWNATRAAGALAAGATELLVNTITFSGDSGGTTVARSIVNRITASGSNNIATFNVFNNFPVTQHTGTITNLRAINCSPSIEGSGNVTTISGVISGISLISSGNVTSCNLFDAVINSLSSTGAITNINGFNANNLGHATLVTQAIGFNASNMTAAVALTASFRSQQNSGTGVWGFLHTGTANSGFNGNVRIGSNVAPTVALDVTGAALISTTLGVTGITTLGNKLYPATDAAATQTATGIYGNTGAPNNANGANGDFYFRADGGLLTTIYQRRAGAWIGIV